MEKLSKRMKKATQIVDREKVYSLEEAVETIAKFPEVKFDETVEMHFLLNIDTKASDQAVRSTVSLPHGWGHHRSGIRLQVAAAHAGVSANDITDEQLLDELCGNAVLNGVPVELSATSPNGAQAGGDPKSQATSSD